MFRAYTGSDSFQLDHKNYYSPYIKEFEQGSARKQFLHDAVFQLKQYEAVEKLKNKRKKGL